jgi:hypothetical protein
MHLLFIHKDFGFLLFVHEREVCLWMSLHMLTVVIPRHLCFLVVYHASTQLAWFTACSEIFWTYNYLCIKRSLFMDAWFYSFIFFPGQQSFNAVHIG